MLADEGGKEGPAGGKGGTRPRTGQGGLVVELRRAQSGTAGSFSPCSCQGEEVCLLASCIDAHRCRTGNAAKLIEVKATAVAPTAAFMSWCSQQLAGLKSTIDVQTFVSFLWEIESETEVKTYATEYLSGAASNIFEFVREFVDRRKAIVSRGGSTAEADQVDDFDFQVKGGAKKKKGKFVKAPANMLSFTTEPPPANDA